MVADVQFVMMMVFVALTGPVFVSKMFHFIIILCREPMSDLFYSLVFAHFVRKDERNNLKYKAVRSSKFHNYHSTYILAFY